jgi:hypothetical protein
MPDNTLEKELTAAIDEVVAADAKMPPTLRPVPVKPPTLAEQWALKEKIEQELYQRIRREKVIIVAGHDQAWAKIKADYETRIDLAVSKLESERRQALQNLADATAEKLREHDLLTQRMARDVS